MRFLSTRFVVAYQRRLIDLFGGAHGIRDQGLLDSALAQPQATFDGALLHADVYEMAAAYAFHICRNHPFIDGNKRIAAVAMATFLDLDGHPLRVDEVALYTTVMALAEGRIDKAALSAWIKEQAQGSSAVR